MNSNVSKEEVFILKRMIEGDENAFKYFFDTYYDDLCNFVNCYIRDEALAEDIVQGIFIDLWERKDALQSDCSVKSYLYTASKNKSLNSIRNEKNKDRIHGLLFNQNEVFSQEKADSFLEFEELKEVVSAAVDGLPRQCKMIYQLSRNEGLTNKEIAERLDITVKTVENQMTIAIRKIKEFMHPYYEQIFILFIVVNFFDSLGG